MLEIAQKHVSDVKGSSNRSFGLVFATVFIILALYPLLVNGSTRIWSLIVAFMFLMLALFIPVALTPFNLLWTKFGYLMHSMVSPFTLAIIFFIIIFPVGLLVRLLSKDSFRLNFDPNAKSYWIKREPPGPLPESLNNQF